MSDKRDKSARELIKKLNRIRHEQAKKIDILCNDMVFAHKEMIEQIGNLTFAVNFYESILGETDLGSLLDRACGLIATSAVNSSVALLLRESEGFELHVVDDSRPIEIDARKLESYFSPELVDNICRANWVCSLEDMFEMGLAGNPAELGRISAAAVPLGRFGAAVGFVLIYRSADRPLRTGELDKVTAITAGLYRAIETCQNLANPAETH